MHLAEKFRYAPILLMDLSLTIVIYITKETSLFIWFWITLPIIIPLVVAAVQLSGKLKSQVIPVSGVITCIFPLPFYLETFMATSSSDGQAGLIFAVMPVYQMFGLVILSVAGYARLAWRKKHYHS